MSRGGVRRPHVVLTPPVNTPGGFSSPEAETMVPCPVCRAGMVSPSVSSAVRELLAKAVNDGPPDPPPSLPCLHTDILETVPRRPGDDDP